MKNNNLTSSTSKYVSNHRFSRNPIEIVAGRTIFEELVVGIVEKLVEGIVDSFVTELWKDSGENCC